MGRREDFTNFVNAVIDEKSFDKLAKYLDAAKADSSVEVVAGGGYDKSVGYFIQPTVLRVDDPKYVTMCDELFGPVLTIYVYDDAKWAETLKLVDETSPYALTGAVFAQDRAALLEAEAALRNAAGNFYLNDKPTGAVVGQQPFGGARASGTNDKAGSSLNLLRWVSARSIKETLVSPTDYRYPFLADELRRGPRRRHLRTPPTAGRNFLFLHSLTAVPHGSAVFFCRKCPRLTPSVFHTDDALQLPTAQKSRIIYIRWGRARKAFLL